MNEKPSPPHEPDYRERTRKALKIIVDEAASEPPLFFPIELREVGIRAVAALQVAWRCHPRLPDPDECETEILQLLYQAGQLRAGQIIATLDTFGKATVERRLSKMVRLGVLRSSKESPRGYNLDPWLRGQADVCSANLA